MAYAGERERLTRIVAREHYQFDVTHDKEVIAASAELVDAVLLLSEMCGVPSPRIARVTSVGELEALQAECELEAEVRGAAAALTELRAIEAGGG